MILQIQLSMLEEEGDESRDVHEDHRVYHKLHLALGSLVEGQLGDSKEVLQIPVPGDQSITEVGLQLLLTQHRSKKLVDDLQFRVRLPNPELQLLEVLVSDDPVLLVVPSSADLHQQLVGTTRLKKDLSTSG